MIKRIIPLILLLASAPSYAYQPGMYAGEMNAIRDNERFYIAFMNLKYSVMLRYQSEWEMIGKRAEPIKREVQGLTEVASARIEMPASIPDNDATRALMRLSMARARAEALLIDLDIAESANQGSFGSIESILQEGGFEEASPLTQLHKENKAQVIAGLEGLRKSTVAYLKIIEGKFEEWKAGQRQAFEEFEKERDQKFQDKLELFDTIVKFQIGYRRLRTQIITAVEAGDLGRAQELLDSYAWIQKALPYWFEGKLVSQDIILRYQDLMQDAAKGFDRVNQLMIKRKENKVSLLLLGQPVVELARVEPKPDLFSTEAVWDVAPNGLRISSNAAKSAGDGSNVPDNEKESSGGKSKDFTYGGNTYGAKDFGAEGKAIAVGENKADKTAGVMIELQHNLQVKDAENFDRPSRMVDRMDRHMDQRLAEARTQPEHPDRAAPDSMQKETGHIGDMVSHARDNEHDDTARAELTKLANDVNRFANIQEHFKGVIGGLLPGTIGSSAQTAVVWALESAQSQLGDAGNAAVGFVVNFSSGFYSAFASVVNSVGRLAKQPELIADMGRELVDSMSNPPEFVRGLMGPVVAFSNTMQNGSTPEKQHAMGRVAGNVLLGVAGGELELPGAPVAERVVAREAAESAAGEAAQTSSLNAAEKATLKPVHSTGELAKGAEEHIMEGEINHEGKLKGGMHSTAGYKNFMKNYPGKTMPKVEPVGNNGVTRACIPEDAMTNSAWKATQKAANKGRGVEGGKSMFPESWSREKIVETIKDVGENGETTGNGKNGGGTKAGTRDGVKVEVKVDADGNIRSGFPASDQE